MAEKNILYMTIPDLKAARAVIEKKIGTLQEEKEPNQTVIQKLQNMVNKYTKAERQINKYFEKNKKKPGFTNGGRNTIKLIEALRWYNKPILGADINPIKKGYNALDGINDLQGVLTGVGVSVMGVASVNQIIKKVSGGEKNLASIIGEFVKNNPGFSAAMASGTALILIAKGVPAIRRKAKQMQSNIAQTRKAQNEITDEIYGDTFDRTDLLKNTDEFKNENKEKGIVSSAQKLGEQLANSPEMLSKFMEVVKNRSAHPEYSNTEVANIVEALKEANKLLEGRKKDREGFLGDGPMGIDKEVYDRKLEEYNIEYAKYEKKKAKYDKRKDNIIHPKKPKEPTAPIEEAEIIISTAKTKAENALAEVTKIKENIETQLATAETELATAKTELANAKTELATAGTDKAKQADAQTAIAIAKKKVREAQAKKAKLEEAKTKAEEAKNKITDHVNTTEKNIKKFKKGVTLTEMQSAVESAEQATGDVDSQKENVETAKTNAETPVASAEMTTEQKKALLKFIDTYLGSKTDTGTKGTFAKKKSDQTFSADSLLSQLKASSKTKDIELELGTDNAIKGLSKDQAEDIAGLLEVLDALSVKDNNELSNSNSSSNYTDRRQLALDNINKLRGSLGLNGLTDDEKKALSNVSTDELGLS